MGLVAAAYPKWGWHLTDHMGNALKARSMVAAMDYNEKFRKMVSLNKGTRWGLVNARSLWAPV